MGVAAAAPAGLTPVSASGVAPVAAPAGAAPAAPSHLEKLAGFLGVTGTNEEKISGVKAALKKFPKSWLTAQVMPKFGGQDIVIDGLNRSHMLDALAEAW